MILRHFESTTTVILILRNFTVVLDSRMSVLIKYPIDRKLDVANALETRLKLKMTYQLAWEDRKAHEHSIA